MPAISQLIPNYVGGVSSQPDDKKSPGQVREIENGYCDATSGLTKRPGFQWIKTLENYNGDTDQLENASWFFINRDNFEAYFGCITKDQNIRIWNAINRQEAVVYGPNTTVVDGEDIPVRLSDEPIDSSEREYLKVERRDGLPLTIALVPHSNFEVVTVKAQSFVINKTKKVREIAGNDYKLRRAATVKIKNVEDLQEYEIFITLDNDPSTRYRAWFRTKKPAITEEIKEDGKVTPAQTPTNADNILTNLRKFKKSQDPDNRFEGEGILNLKIPGMSVRKYETSLEIKCNTSFRIDVQAGVGGNALEVYQDEVGNSSRLSESSVDGRLVKVVNTLDERSSYFVKFVANDPQKEDVVTPGTGYWQESIGWEDPEDGSIETVMAAPGLDATTMPYALINTAPDTFVFTEEGKLENTGYEPRLVGNSDTNSAPSFVSSDTNPGYLNEGFVYANRFGLLSGENVILSQAAELKNFYFTSAQTVVDSDPIDLNCTSIRPANLYGAIPQTQGMILFSAGEQFNMFADGDTLTPSSTVIRSISNYEASTNIKPVDIGTNIIFVSGGSQQSAFTRTMAMTTRGQDNSPIVVDIGKVASEYVPNNIDFLLASSQNSFIAMSSQGSHDVYFYRFFNNGEKDIMQSWFKWTVPGMVQTLIVANDQVFTIAKGNGEYNLLGAALNQSSKDGMAALRSVNPRMDMYYSPMNMRDVNGDPVLITYDPVTNTSIIPRPYDNSDAYEPIIIEVPEMAGFGGQRLSDILLKFVNPGLDYDQLSPDSVGFIPHVTVDDSNNWTIRGNWEGKENRILGGIKYKFSVELPTTFYRKENIADYTASLTLGRYKFSFGNTGFVEFKSQAFGSDEWNKVEPVPDANYYNANTAPFTPETIITVPIHQKNKNFNFKIESDSPTPVSINSMMWEGQYYPRFYKRV